MKFTIIFATLLLTLATTITSKGTSDQINYQTPVIHKASSVRVFLTFSP